MSETPLYEHTQPGRFIVTTILLTMALMVAIIVWAQLSGEAGEDEGWVLYAVILPVMIIMGLIMWIFSSLSVKVTTHTFEFWFGPGVARKRIPIEAIRSVQTVTNPWYWGYGIRVTPHGMLYNVSGNKAVEVEYREKKKTKALRVGTDEPDQLEQVLRSFL